MWWKELFFCLFFLCIVTHEGVCKIMKKGREKQGGRMVENWYKNTHLRERERKAGKAEVDGLAMIGSVPRNSPADGNCPLPRCLEVVCLLAGWLAG